MRRLAIFRLAIFRLAIVAFALLLVPTGAGALAAEMQPSAADTTFFEARIRPVLVKHCYECHAEGAKEIGGRLRLDSHEGVRAGGVSGAALVPGKPDESLLLKALKFDGVEMPPTGRLPDNVVADFAEWIRRGAVDPRVDAATAQASGQAAGAQERPWSLQPVQDPAIPPVQNAEWPRTPIDRFILSRIEPTGQKPTRDAEPRVLVRRIYYDLIGLPPTIEEANRFVTEFAEQGQPAVERLVDRLLASPQYGERWGRFWLDVARYGESNGNDGISRNTAFPHAWRYRDYVIVAFNADMPYDQFVTEQLAGDLLPSASPAERDRRLVATGLLAIIAKPAMAMNSEFQMDIIADQIDVVGRGLLGISVACARCHDHKFDPIPTRDYYALAGIFASTETLWGTACHEALSAPVTDLHVLQTAPHVLPPADFVETVFVIESNTGKPKPPPASKWPLGTPLAMGVRDRPKPADVKILQRGDSSQAGESVPRGVLSAVQGASPAAIDPAQSGRLQLAQWIANPEHPLTARVMVNRVWQQLFGEGIVRTPDDFGRYGERPTHPELLDHLVVQFVREGWSVKRLVRSIVLSRTYQLASDADATLIAADAENRLFARGTRRRLEAEPLRDSMLMASGELDLTPGEGSLIRHRDIMIQLAGNLHQPSRKRSIYLCYLRNALPPDLIPFDLPEFTAVVGKRGVSTISSQALHFYNSPFVIEQSLAFARLVIRDANDSTARVRLAWQRALGRDPQAAEIEQALTLVQQTQSEVQSEERAWASLCQVLLTTNEFRYVD